MLTHEITAIAGKNKKRKRLGRGQGSGHGKTSGRGHKGAGSRSGFKKKTIYEGGQMPLFRRLPKRGFSNVQFETKYEIVNISQLDAFEDGSKVGLEELHKAGLVNLARSRAAKVKILGDGELSKKLEVSAHKFSKAAQDKITGIGGSATVLS